jgi:hypothetical protein
MHEPFGALLFLARLWIELQSVIGSDNRTGRVSYQALSTMAVLLDVCRKPRIAFALCCVEGVRLKLSQ